MEISFLVFSLQKRKKKITKKSLAQNIRLALNFRNKEKMHWNYEGIVSISQNVMK